jgi:RNA polymerase sigma factor (sigma-70 family)
MNINLLAEYLDYIKDRIRFYDFSPPLNYDCCIDFVLEKLGKKIIEYDKNKSTIKTFLSRYTKYYVLNYIRDGKQKPILSGSNTISRTLPDSKFHVDYGVTIDKDNDFRSPETDYWQEKKDQIINDCINELKTPDRDIILMYYFEDKTQEEIGRALNISHQAISNHIKKAEEIIKPKIEEKLAELEYMKQLL